MKTLSLATALSLVGLLALAAGQPPELAPAQKSKDGNTLLIPVAEQAKGAAYYALTDRDRQIYFESNAPLENIKGQSNKVIGYAVMSTREPGSLVAGEWHLPVASMKTGIELRDEHLASKDWLNAASNPDVIFRIKETKDITVVKATDAFTSYSATLVGDLLLHGVTRTITIPNSTITLMSASEATRSVAKGDLVALRSKFTITLADYGVSHPVIGKKVASEVALDVSLYLSTVPPDKQEPSANRK